MKVGVSCIEECLIYFWKLDSLQIAQKIPFVFLSHLSFKRRLLLVSIRMKQPHPILPLHKSTVKGMFRKREETYKIYSSTFFSLLPPLIHIFRSKNKHRVFGSSRNKNVLRWWSLPEDARGVWNEKGGEFQGKGWLDVCSVGLAYLVFPDFWVPFLHTLYLLSVVPNGNRRILGEGYLKKKNKEV